MHIFQGETMRTTLNIEDDLLSKASKLTGIKEKTSLVRRGLESLIAIESGKRLARLGGSEKALKPVPRRRSEGK
jgi:Arc/MetJ family transcription regulator